MPAPDTTRTELREWLSSRVTDEIRTLTRHRGDDERFERWRDWNRELFDAGWAVPSWPSQWGGRAADLATQLAIHEEMSAAGAPGPVNQIGVANIAPAILSFGTAEQQERFLRPMLRGDAIWSQGMSEPEAGSDLAALRCRAELDGDHFVVTGQKTWNSNGDRAEWCQLYVRTNPDVPRHQGITCLLLDMSLDGIEVRPIRTMTGDAGFAEVFLDEVRVPTTAVLGAVDDGWSVATGTLGNERAGVATLYLHLLSKLERLLAEARTVRADGTAPSDDARVRQQLAQRWCEVRTLEFVAKRSLGAALAGQTPGPEGSIIKLAWSLADQRLTETAVDVLGFESLSGPWAWELLSSRSLTIAGGTSEVNRNIVGERVLGLPREPKPQQG